MSVNGTAKTPLVNRWPLFWDISPERIPEAFVENDDWAIVRIFEHGSIQDIFDAIAFYGREKTSEVLNREKLQPTARVMAYLFLNVDPEHRYNL